MPPLTTAARNRALAGVLAFARPRLDVAAAGVAVCILAWLAISLTAHTGRAADIWPANGVILACLIRAPAKRWPGFLLSGLVGNLAGNLLAGDQLGVGLCLAGCNSAEILAVAAGLRRLLGEQLHLQRTRHLLTFAFLAVVAAAATALVAASLLNLTGSHDFPRTLAMWMLADALGLMIITPTLLALNRAAMARFLAPGQIARNLALIVLLVAVTAASFLAPHMQMRFLVLPVLVMLAYKAETAGAALGLMVTGVVAVVMSVLGHGAVTANSSASEMAALVLQFFLLASAVTCFPVAAAMVRRRELEASLAATAREYQMLADHSTDIILRFDRDDTILYVSPSCRRFGYEPADLIGRTGYELLHPDDLDRMKRLVADLFTGASLDPNTNREQRLKTANGDWVWMEGSPQPVTGPDGKVIEFVTQLRDITVRKASEEALARSEERYRLLADRATDIIIRYNPAGVIEFATPSVRLLGYQPKDMVGRNLGEFLQPDAQIEVRRRGAALMEGRSLIGTRNEFQVLCANGDWLWLEGNPALIRNDAGEVVGIVTVLRDVTARREMEEDLRRKQAEAEAAGVAKSEFLANMSHEIRTPLTGIIGFAGLLEGMRGLPESAMTYANRIATSGQTLLAVVNDILDFSKIEAGQVDLEARPFAPETFVAETIELILPQAQARGLSVAIQRSGEIPAAVMADSARLRQVLLNLLTNAIKFTEHGGLDVEISYLDELESLRIAVTDTGVGIPADRADRLFQRFSQADGSINRRYGGTGLGLAICKSLTGLMGGDIGVESVVGEGSTFWFTIAAPAAALPAPVHAPLDEVWEGNPARILVVDDVAVNRELVKAMLAGFGLEIFEAAGGAEAVETAMATPFDLILMDLQMPGVDGLSATRRIRATSMVNRDTPIVALSANVMPVHQDACRAAGMVDHIAKPINATELLTKVARWTDVGSAQTPDQRQAV